MSNTCFFRGSVIKLVGNLINRRAFSVEKSGSNESTTNSPTHSKPSAKKLLDEAATFHNDPSPEDEWSTSPYPKGAEIRSQANHSFRPLVNPQETSIILFPGQGTQYVGMANDIVKFPSAKDLFDSASAILKYDLLKLCLNGPLEKLNKTEFAQPAILVCSLGALERLKEEKPSAIENCVATAGFSLGELSALVLAGVLSFEKGSFINIHL